MKKNQLNIFRKLSFYIENIVILIIFFLWGNISYANGMDCGWYKPITMIGTISGSAESPSISWNSPENVSSNCRDVNGNVVLGTGESVMDNEYYMGSQSLNPEVRDGRIYYKIREGVTYSHKPLTWNDHSLSLNSWISSGPYNWHADWISPDFTKIANDSKITVNPNSVLAGNVNIPLTLVGNLYVWDSQMIRTSLIDLYIVGNVYVQGGCNVSPAALEVDFGNIKNTNVVPKNLPFTLSCKNASANGYDIYINGENSGNSRVRLHSSDNPGVDVILSTGKLSEADGGKIINMNLKASLVQNGPAKPYGAFNASAFMDIRVP